MSHNPLISFDLPFEELRSTLMQSFQGMHHVGKDDEQMSFSEIPEFLRFLYAIINGPVKKAYQEIGPARSASSIKNFDETWDIQAKYWAMIESSANYVMSYALLTHHLSLAQDDRVLSLGAGPGIYETYMAKTYTRTSFTCSDLSREMGNFTRSISEGIPNLTITQANMTDLHFDSGYFTKTFCNNALQWVMPEKVEASLREIKRVTRKNGKVVLIVHEEGMSEQIQIGDIRAMIAPRGQDYVTIRTMCENLGFRNILPSAFIGTNAGQTGDHSLRILLKMDT